MYLQAQKRNLLQILLSVPEAVSSSHRQGLFSLDPIMMGRHSSQQISITVDLGEIARAKFDFDVVGHYSRPEVLSLIVRDHPATPVTFTSASAKTDREVSHKS
ncbi:hypothetical protein C1H46_044671 [Malus baccata]|uniref:CN hydrolase domain-containing protein n=1 Tax=Malus baccata TaxID=106549 RepID=A0A540K6F3_MALBA|nr:hypothetical protein C1H46_044671 [Malus baccata]